MDEEFSVASLKRGKAKLKPRTDQGHKAETFLHKLEQGLESMVTRIAELETLGVEKTNGIRWLKKRLKDIDDRHQLFSQ